MDLWVGGKRASDVCRRELMDVKVSEKRALAVCDVMCCELVEKAFYVWRYEVWAGEGKNHIFDTDLRVVEKMR
jgi:hypothetical protein